MSPAEYEGLRRDATQITVAFTQQAVIPDNGFDSGADFGRFWAECYKEICSAARDVEKSKRAKTEPDDGFDLARGMRAKMMN